MKLNEDMKKLMLYLFNSDKFSRYDIGYDKREDTQSPLKITIYLSETQWWTVIFTDKITVREWYQSKTYWRPSDRVTFINKYLKKYRNTGRGEWGTASLDIDTLISILENKVKEPTLLDPKDLHHWYPVRKATVIW